MKCTYCGDEVNSVTGLPPRCRGCNELSRLYHGLQPNDELFVKKYIQHQCPVCEIFSMDTFRSYYCKKNKVKCEIKLEFEKTRATCCCGVWEADAVRYMIANIAGEREEKQRKIDAEFQEMIDGGKFRLLREDEIPF